MGRKEEEEEEEAGKGRASDPRARPSVSITLCLSVSRNLSVLCVLRWQTPDSGFPKFCHVEGALLTPCAVPRFGGGITSGLLTNPSTQLFSNDLGLPAHRPLFFSLRKGE